MTTMTTTEHYNMDCLCLRACVWAMVSLLVQQYYGARGSWKLCVMYRRSYTPSV